MNREIKFRAWDDSQMLSMPLDTNYGISRFFGLLSDSAIIMQFTGLCDKNGKEIYEGDVVNMIYDEPKDRPHVVVWHKYKFIAIHTCEYNRFLDHQNEIYFLNTGKTPNSHNAEIIGNIHQNP